MSLQCTCDVQSTPDNSNLQGKSKLKSSSYGEFELSLAQRVAGGTAQ